MNSTVVTIVIILIGVIIIFCTGKNWEKYQIEKIKEYNNEFKLEEIEDSDQMKIINRINKNIVIEQRIIDEINEHKYTETSILTLISLCISSLALINAVFKPIFENNTKITDFSFILVIGSILAICMFAIITNIAKEYYKSKIYKEIRKDLKKRLIVIRNYNSEMKTKLYEGISKNLQSNNEKNPNIIKQFIDIISSIVKI